MTDNPGAQPRQNPLRGKYRVFYWLLIAFAAVGILCIGITLLRPHYTGTVLSAGRVTTGTARHGIGKNVNIRKFYSADVKVRRTDTGEVITVYYRAPSADNFPQAGDEVEFANTLLVGYQPYPQMWAVWLGLAILGGDLLVYLGFLIARRRKTQAEAPA